ncbi:hypothetical protein JD969_00510 [Planctomycetota bacterium]|nr:hypothetical protein JD969_00510 [Planctomycetota bacterium]
MPVQFALDLDQHFPRYTDYSPELPVWCLTPNVGRCTIRFFDTSPLSPSGRYVAVTRLPHEYNAPQIGDTAEIVLIDLQTGEENVITTTQGFEGQLGANINWGADDNSLFFNDVDTNTWQPHAIRINPFTGDKTNLQGTICHASPNGKHIASCRLSAMRFTQYGYGVLIPDQHIKRNFGLSNNDGLYITNTQTGQIENLITLKQIVDAAGPNELQTDPDQFEIYGFHTKYNPQGDRILFTLRWYPKQPKSPTPENQIAKDGIRFAVYTLKPDGSDIHLAVGPDQWALGGHHINWYPDGCHLSMNLNINAGPLRFVSCKYDGSNLRSVTNHVLGSGHPSVHPSGMIMSDTYTWEPGTSYGDGTIPIRWIDPIAGTEKSLLRINTNISIQRGEMRIDPHPAWDRTWRYVFFNAFTNNSRRVFIMDTQPLFI